MKFLQTMSYWRVALVAAIYGGLYVGYKGYAQWWLLAFIIPFFILFRPVPSNICAFKKAREAGLIFYVFKWGLISMAGLLILMAYYAYTLGEAGSFLEMAKVFVKNGFVIVPMFLAIFVSWSVNQRQYMIHCFGKEEDKPKRKGKKKKKKHKK